MDDLNTYDLWTARPKFEIHVSKYRNKYAAFKNAIKIARCNLEK